MNPLLAERENPPPRRKSCEACKTAKRRCDLAFPACSRCATRNTPCIYPGRQPAIPQKLIDEMFESIAQTVDTPLSFDSCTTEFRIPELPGPPAIAHPFDVFDPQWDYIDIDAPCLAEAPTGVLIPRPSYTMTAPVTRPPMALSEIIASRLQFAIDVLKDVPKMMVQENQTPWSHKQLYVNGMPKHMQDAYSSCALHITQNAINRPVITSLINTNIQTLLTSPVATTPLETLSHTHALLLYQIMLFFSPDPSANLSLIPHLESSALTLLSCIYFPDPSYAPTILPPTTEAKQDFWTSWIFQESARRTVLFAFYLIQLHRLVQGERNLVCDGSLGLVHSWYLSAYLWEAQDAGEFGEAWMEKDHFVVGQLNFGRVLTEARAGDVDVFGRMLLVSYLGIEEARAWFLARGAIL
ncbi:hypothetical protein BDV32DRAFT_141701 [Aspergillus pseudonomiae]|uniref:Uncharacterized protein n=1 Tax=Aspergillus pseudonomiae TaxID=1506151 RepID=A0A5N7DFZ4_9EURO|nr:uncharacterized protein BDV37DRAFT_245648 [Aspergillus pseudonomiae]KAB8255856.1 hypothetical protein BDV32DRAFT_141701 [Aspergillus pseudonomiae]KAE8405366.1 hypothetical protein BDV37DRAFT_245648 [Aspergillus pseudonomiae]